MSKYLTDRWFPIPEHVRKHAVQKSILSCKTQYRVIAAGRRSYKTERFIKRDAVTYAMANAKQRIMIGAPTRSQAKGILWDDIKALIPKYWLARRPNETELSVRLVNGSEIHVVGLAEYKRVEGILWHRAYITEMQVIDPEFFSSTLQPILNDTGGVGVFEGRPLGKNHFYDLFLMAKTNPNWASFHWPSSDVLTEHQISEALRTLTQEDYDREYNAEFNTAGQVAYYAYSAPENHREFGVIPKDGKRDGREFSGIDCNYPVIITCDFNANEKPMSWTIGQEHNDCVYWYKSMSYTYTNTEAMCMRLKEEFATWPDTPKALMFYGDYAGTQNRSNSSYTDWQLIETHFSGQYDFTKKIIPCLSVRDRVAATNGMLCNAMGERRMFVNAQLCKPLLEDWERVSWKSNGVELDQTTDVRRTHNSDSVDYYSYARTSRIRIAQ